MGDRASMRFLCLFSNENRHAYQISQEATTAIPTWCMKPGAQCDVLAELFGWSLSSLLFTLIPYSYALIQVGCV